MASDEPLRKCARCSVYSKSCSPDCNFRMAFPPHTGTGPLYDVVTFKQIAELFRKKFLNRAFAGMLPEDTLEFRKTLEFICEEFSKDSAGGPRRLAEELKLQLHVVNVERVACREEVTKLEKTINTLESELAESRQKAEADAIEHLVIEGKNNQLSSELNNLGKDNAELQQKHECAELRIDQLKHELKKACEVVGGSQERMVLSRGELAEITTTLGKILEEIKTMQVSDLSSVEQVKQVTLGFLANITSKANVEQ